MSKSTPFDWLGLPVTFALDPNQIAEAHRAQSRVLHPDRHRDKPAGERRMLLERAMQVGEAFRVLRDPARRALCLLELAGHDVQQEPAVPEEFLFEVMEDREQLASVRGQRGPLSQLIEQVRQRRAQTEAELASSFAAERLSEVLPLVAKLRYDTRFLEEAENLVLDLDDNHGTA